MQILRRSLIILSLLCVICIYALSWGEDLHSIEANFEQTIVSEDGVPARYMGHIIAKSPNLVKWDYQSPLDKQIYMNGSDVIIYEASLQQASYSKLRTKSDFLSIITSAKKREDGAYYTNVDNVEYVMFLDKNGKKPERIEFVDNLGSKTTLKLLNVKLNIKVNETIFQFTPPEGTEIVQIKK